MPECGIFVTLYDEATLALYLQHGVYGTLMPPTHPGRRLSSVHYGTLADYACVREGTHVFFFLKRTITYGGQARGSASSGAFFLNGMTSVMGQTASAPLCWDESTRACYEASDAPGVFALKAKPDAGVRCQPYLVLFADRTGLQGKRISSDALYWRLGEYGYPLPANAIQAMSFCTLTPGETRICLELLGEAPARTRDENEDAHFIATPVPYVPAYGWSDVAAEFAGRRVSLEAQLEASVIANPNLLPEPVRPRANDAICRQVPISPFKPYWMDRADICYYSSESIHNGTIPNTIIELKKERAGRAAVSQVERYLEWMYRIAGGEAERISAFIVAPSFARTAVPQKYSRQIQMIPLAE